MSPILLAHAGPGSTWQAAVVVIGVVLACAVVLVAAGVLTLEGPADLIAVLAVAVSLGALGMLGREWISDGIGWALPVAIVALLTLGVAAWTRLGIAATSPLFAGFLALALVGGVVLYGPLTIALHPPADLLPLSHDATLTIMTPADGETLAAGATDVVVRVDGGSIGPVHSEVSDLGDDPEEAGSLTVFLDDRRVDPTWDGCTVAAPCDQVTFPVALEPGTHRLTVELTRGDGTPLAPFIADRVDVTAR